MISLSMGGKGVCSSGPTFVGVVRPEVVVAVSTLSRSSLERWVNVDCMIEEEIFGCVLVVVLQRAVRGKGALVIGLLVQLFTSEQSRVCGVLFDLSSQKMRAGGCEC